MCGVCVWGGVCTRVCGVCRCVYVWCVCGGCERCVCVMCVCGVCILFTVYHLLSCVNNPLHIVARGWRCWCVSEATNP